MRTINRFKAAVAAFQKRGAGYYGNSITDIWPTLETPGSYMELNLSAFWRAFSLISGTIASLPINVYRQKPDGSRIPAVDTELYRILHIAPNPLMTVYDFMQAVSMNLEVYNEAYVIVIIADGKIEAYPIQTPYVTELTDGSYRITFKSKIVILDASMVLHIPGKSFDGINPGPLPFYRRRVVKLANAQEDTASEFFENGIIPATVFIHGTGYKDDQLKTVKTEIQKLYAGRGNRFKSINLGPGSDVKQLQFDPEKVQLLASRKYTTIQIAQFTDIPPNKLYDLEKASFSNIEEQNREYILDTIVPRVTRIEQRLERFFVPEKEQAEFKIEINVDGYLRGNQAARWSAYKEARYAGVYNADEIRRKENDAPIEGRAGTMYWQPVNMMDASSPVAVAATTEERAGRSVKPTYRKASVDFIKQRRGIAENKRVITNGYAPVFRSATEKTVATETAYIRELIAEGKSSAELITAIQNYYSDSNFGAVVKSNYTAAVNGIGESIAEFSFDEVNADPTDIAASISSYLDNLAIRHILSSKRQLIDVVAKADDIDEEVETRLVEWEQRRPGKIERAEPIKSEGAFSTAAWKAAAVQGIMWLAFGESCPYCSALDGTIIAIGQSFLKSGEAFEPKGAERPLTSSTNIGHAPAHDGCDCGLSPILIMG